MKFSDFSIPSTILNTLKRMGFDEMTPIQEETYPIISQGHDLCALAQTGSGKTAACAIPLVEKIDPEKNTIQGLVVVPTRELCIQYADEIHRIAENTSVVAFAVYGGFDKGIQVAKIKHQVHILVATPGRLIDMIYSGDVSLSHVKCVILDEADELLKEGFFEDIEFIMSCIRHDHQTLLFAATMADDIKKLADDCLKDPKNISLIKRKPTPASIEHCFMYTHPKEKEEKLISFLNNEDVTQVIMFCNTRQLVDKVFHSIRKKLRNVEYIHAGLPQGKRTSIITQFRSLKIKYLLASDVAGRGLDFTHVSHVINWDYPKGLEQYTHRTGRAGRMGRTGKALTFVSRGDLSRLQKLFRIKQINPVWIGSNPLQDGNITSGDRTFRNKKKPYRKNRPRRRPEQ